MAETVASDRRRPETLEEKAVEARDTRENSSFMGRPYTQFNSVTLSFQLISAPRCEKKIAAKKRRLVQGSSVQRDRDRQPKQVKML
eukprot:g53333.t1